MAANKFSSSNKIIDQLVGLIDWVLKQLQSGDLSPDWGVILSECIIYALLGVNRLRMINLRFYEKFRLALLSTNWSFVRYPGECSVIIPNTLLC